MKKVIAFFVAFCMMLCVSPVVFADEPLNYVVLGDSIGYGAGIFNSEGACYGRIVADSNGYTYANDAVSGHRSQDMLGRIREPAVLADIEKADIISISIGGNDFLQQNLPKLIALAAIGDFHHLDNIEADLYANFSEVIDTIKSVNPDCLILAQTLYNTHIAVMGAIYDLAIPRVNRVVYSYLENNPGAYEIIDLATEFECHPEYVAIDTIHPTAVGNVAIAEVILDHLAGKGISVGSDEIVINATGIDEIPFSSYIIKSFFDLFRKILSIF